MEFAREAYLDLETSGLSWQRSIITVLGLYVADRDGSRLAQLVGTAITRETLVAALHGVTTIYTYNGTRFDLPFISAALGCNVTDLCCHHDLMYDCWERKLYGGLRAVESTLGIPRQTKSVTGRQAVILWRTYQCKGDRKALDLLLQYNRDDVANLKLLREKLAEPPWKR